MNYFDQKWVLLLVGGILLGFTGLNWNIPFFAWFALVPFLRYVRLGHSWWILLFALILIQTASTMRIVSEPFHIGIAVISGIQGGFVFTLLLWIWNQIRLKFSNQISPILSFAFLFTIFEWLGGYGSELGVWGMFANSQMNHLMLMQSASLFGATGISFLIFLVNGSIEQTYSELINQFKISKYTRNSLIACFLLIVVLLFYGTIRLTIPIDGKSIKVGTVTSKIEIQTMWLDPIVNQKNTEIVFQRTEQAANEGAKVIVWNEGAVLIHRNEEDLFLKRVSDLAKEKNIEIVAAYIVPLKEKEFFMDNKLHWIGKDGSTRQIYFKQFIPPGEPVSHTPSEIRVIETDWGKMSVAICYDFDSLQLTKKHSELGTGVTFIPASDWRGINPFHTEMATLRGIENGSSIVRSTRGALSGIYDAYGRPKGTLDYFEDNDGVLVASVPVNPVPTLYQILGNWMIALGGVYFLLCGAFILVNVLKKRN
ncbi:acyltransferase [Leptospira sp. 2 VSF19]|uniref:Acyltransferase n=1 Tax=Leptospira soteropolitanensis TaxID=2950025 RepID=A0AAW5VI06_9LEPT|nr:nitrilase-related carbon-nitrogen hydrolase [Leptospira soteropolitanensis]MCW7493632.1 acyltransferase [Leptospira soteropolitanensis]MCW7501231.1 acyltransferase [Leptospira soteropolitanensis]MCW7523583.1 acyltransferase [Leptospira soteropolitanensis]MCW7527344.1 acyltransferase [Leptospira soteropolitanensis]MCW7531201.1 acyltransferase [Leptospira soteropolitanensis]